jgi:hypothetical protein
MKKITFILNGIIIPVLINAQIPDLQVPIPNTTTNATSPANPNLYVWTEQTNIEQGINIFLSAPTVTHPLARVSASAIAKGTRAFF